jgi:hypothetical protein
MPKITVNDCKCQITEKRLDVPSQKLDTGQQNQRSNLQYPDSVVKNKGKYSRAI